MKKIILISFLALGLAACMKRSSHLLRLGKAPSFKLTNQDGKTITDDFYKGKVYVCEFFFTTCPTICPVMNRHMVKIQNKFKKNDHFAIASFTVDPKTDTPDVLRAYAKNLGATSKNWNFLTGDPKTIYDLAAKGYFVSAGPNTFAPGGFLHSQYFILVDKKGYIRTFKDKNGNPLFYDGTKLRDLARVEKDIKHLLDE